MLEIFHRGNMTGSIFFRRWGCFFHRDFTYHNLRHISLVITLMITVMMVAQIDKLDEMVHFFFCGFEGQKQVP